MAEAPAEVSPELTAKQQFDEHLQQGLIRSFEGQRYLTEAAVDLSNWAPYVDWSARLSGEDIIKNPLIVEAFERVRRYDFLPPESKHRAAEDRPLPIGHGQTNSQPSTVGRMLEWLDIQPGQKILDLGAGSGWTSALLADVVGPEGVVHGTERITELVRTARGNLARHGHLNATIHRTPRRLGLAAEAPYDRILVSASALESWAMELFRKQLSTEGGIIVVPIADEGTNGNSKFDKKVVALQNYHGQVHALRGHEGYSFVPLVLPEKE